MLNAATENLNALVGQRRRVMKWHSRSKAMAVIGVAERGYCVQAEKAHLVTQRLLETGASGTKFSAPAL